MNKIDSILFVIVIWAVFIIASIIFPVSVTYYAYAAQENKTDSLSEADKNRRLDLYLDKLASYECDGCDDAFRLLDSNGRWSHSCLQFQERTFEEMAVRYDFASPGAPVLQEWIGDCGIQKAVAKRMFLEDAQKASLHWYTSIHKRGLGLPDLK